MKQLILGLILLSTHFANAQDSLGLSNAVTKDPSDFKPNAGTWSTEAIFYLQTGSNALRFGLTDIKVRKFITNKTVARTRFLANVNNETTIIVGSSGNMERSIKNATFVIAPGFETHINGSKRLSPYWGMELAVGSTNYEYNLTNSVNGQSFALGGNFNSQSQGNYQMGANAIFGADYYITSQIFIGVELGYGFLYQNFGTNEIQISSNGNVNNNSTPMGSNSGLNLFSNPGIRLGIAF